MENLINEIADHVKGLFATHQKPSLLYHNLSHTEAVVDHSKEIAAHYTLTSDEHFELTAAAWFHDTGQLVGDIQNHEQRSVRLMLDFLLPQKVDPEILTNITCCIMATQMPPRPVRLTEQILCDADTYHLGTLDFWKSDPLVWEEIEARLHHKISDRIVKSIQFLSSHRYFTTYCQQLLTNGKNRNLERLKFLQKK